MRLNLRGKLIFVSALTYILIFVGFVYATNNLINKGYLELESETIDRQTAIGLNTLELRVNELNHITKEYASRDNTYYFIQNNMRHYINDLIMSSTFIENDLNFMVFYNNQGDILYSKSFDLTLLKNTDFDKRVQDAIAANPELFNLTDRKSEVSGLINSEAGPLMISSHPITYSDEDYGIIGTMICGRYLDTIELAKLRDYSYQNLNLIGYNDTPIPLSDGINVWRQNDETISGLTTIKDINGKPILALEVDSPRDMYMQGQRTVMYFYVSMILTGATVGLFAIYMLNRFVLDRILGLSEEVSNIDPKSLEAKSLSIPGDDEISKLSEDIDGMLQTIKDYQDLLKKRERMATIGQTAAMVGHDLRNPLQVIYMLGSRLNRVIKQLRKIENVDPLASELEYIENNLSEQTGYMNKIVSDLQDFSKSIALSVGETDMEHMVMDVLETLDIPENVDVSVVFGEDARQINVDGNYFRRVVVNLLTNAIQAMPDGGKLSVNGSASNDVASITVSDTGIGVSEDNMSKLFTPLFTTKAKGTGLGLAVCKRIIDAHDGEITVESEEGVGTTFTILLPMTRKEESTLELPSSVEMVKEAPVSESRVTS
jgi:signal transduction histidine kinase